MYLCFLCIAMISPAQTPFGYCVVVNSKIYANASKNKKIIFANMLLIWTIGKPLFLSIVSGNPSKFAPTLSHKLHTTTFNNRLHSISSLWHPWISNMHDLKFPKLLRTFFASFSLHQNKIPRATVLKHKMI